ncbi:DNA cytosine methyltransferase [Luminiphilus syltensis]|uniref:DNA cytosine methyltransferase n=1 Tax=Luminiphilus syltensis TaxID=1341119 RepID=UPI0002DFD464|nr:DNA cytosine methyltransferase [Luminiphilus syltensis]
MSLRSTISDDAVLKKVTARKEARFKFIDLFAGIGGFRLGLEAQGGRSVFASEWDKTAKEYYFRNHGDYPFGDINKFTGEHLSDEQVDQLVPDHDLLAGGFPCQPFSIAGVSARNFRGSSHGFSCKTQGTLFFSIERLARIKRPKVLFLENVKNITRHDQGRTFNIIRESLESAGYAFNYKIIDSQSVVAQRRVRCFMVAVRNDIAANRGAFEFPKFPEGSIPLRSVLSKEPDPKYTLSDKMWAGHKARTIRNVERGTGFTALEANLDKPSNTIVARYGKDAKECLVPQTGRNPRYLTIDECRQLFGYPETFQLPASKTPAYKLLGNSVIVPVVQAIASSIKRSYFSGRDMRQ